MNEEKTEQERQRQMMHLHERVSRAMQEAGPDRRRELAKQMVPNVRRRAGELAKELRKRIAEVLRPEQREKGKNAQKEVGLSSSQRSDCGRWP